MDYTAGIPEDALLRHVLIRPYLEGLGPVFRLLTYDTRREEYRAGKWPRQSILGYRLWMDDKLIFSGEDYFPGLTIAIDGDASLRHLLSFLTSPEIIRERFEGEDMEGYLREAEFGGLSLWSYDGAELKSVEPFEEVEP